MAIDTETTSLKAMEAELVGISLAVTPYEAAYIPVAHKSAPIEDPLFNKGIQDATPQLPISTVLNKLRPLLTDSAVLKVGHNLKYDLLVLKKYDVEITPIDDTMVLSYLLSGTKHGHGMDELSLLHLNHRCTPYKDVVGYGKDMKRFDEISVEKAYSYAAEDADITLRLHQLLKPRIAQEHVTTIYETLERPLIHILTDMEQAGVLIDAKILHDMSRRFATLLEEEEAVIHKLAGRAFNVASPKQLGEILFDEMKIDGGKKGKTGAYSTSADVLETLAGQGHEIADKVLEWRGLAKLKSTYTDALPGEVCTQTGRIHTSFAMTLTNTGRLSSNSPNLQNIPIRTPAGKAIRTAFVAPKGHKIVALDYSQVELRLLAHLADIDVLKNAFKQGQDIHALTASQVFGIPLEKLTSEERRKAKAINFGIIYGISAFGLARQLKIPQKEASEYIKAYNDQYPGIRNFMQSVVDETKKTGVVNTIFGRKIFIHEINSSNPARRSFAERQAINAPLQGSSADITKRAMVAVTKAIETEKLPIKMILQVHDELVFEIPEQALDQVIPRLRQLMMGAANLSIPLVVDADVGDSWGDMQPYQFKNGDA